MALFTRVTANTTLNVTNCYLKFIAKDQKTWCLSSVLKHSFFASNCQHRNTRYTHSNVNKSNKTSKSPGTTRNESSDDSRSSAGSFDQVIADRRAQATKTVIVQVQSPESFNDLYLYCSGFGPIENAHQYTILKSTHFFILEFQDVESREALMKAATHINNQEIIPTSSHMLWFRNGPRRKRVFAENIPITPVARVDKPTDELVTSMLMKHRFDISEQMKDLHDVWKLDDIGSRLRFLTAHQIENNFSSLFPNVCVLPFGSSVNGFGRRGCDLDLVMDLDPDKREKNGSRLVFHTKSCLPDQRAQTKRTMETISGILSNFIPGIRNVRKILNARVPIIKYDHALTGLECDLSMTNMTAVYMSELLFLYGEIHEAVRPLVFTIRQWAHSVGITNTNPGSWITNFSLSLLVLFHLQQKNILPPINTLKKLARPSDIRVAYTFGDCTFLRDPNLVPRENIPRNSLESLLSDFFDFYANFDFSNKAVSLRDGLSLYKRDASPLYICNPLEQTLNVSKNVNVAEITRFVEASRNAAMLMNERVNLDSRGLLDIFAEKQPQNTQVFVSRNEKKVRISDLFEPEQTPEDLKEDVIQVNQSRLGHARRR